MNIIEKDYIDIIEECYGTKKVLEQKIHYGRQRLFRFENSYGLSVIEESVGPGPKYNIAIIKFEIGDNEYNVDYNTGIANNDVKSDKEEVIIHLLSLVEKL